MIDHLKPYSKYMDSGLSWLPMVPTGWDVRRNGRLFAQRNEIGYPELPILEVSLRTGVRVRDFENSKRKQVIAEKEKYKRACRYDIAYNMMRMWQGAVGVVPVDGLVSPAYIVARPLSDADPRYFVQLFCTDAYKNVVNIFSRGIVSDRNRLYWEDFKQIPTPFPPPEEQAAIVRFLDHANGKIERAIRAKRKLIALLNEQKQAIIHRAVTRGLDPTVEFAPSGIPWLGNVPEHWEVRRAKYVFKEVDERSKTGNEELLSVSHVTGVTPRSEKNITMFKAASYVGYKLCRPNDLVINTMWAWMAALGSSNRLGIVSSAYGVYRPLRQRMIFGRYIEALLHTPHYMADILFRSTGIRASRLRLYPEEFLKIPLTLPPYDEQVAMFQWADGETKHLSSAIARTEREIELLHEYRTTLTAEVVTGKLDVREAAKRLPAEVEPSIPTENSSTELELDEPGDEE